MNAVLLVVKQSNVKWFVAQCEIYISIWWNWITSVCRSEIEWFSVRFVMILSEIGMIFSEIWIEIAMCSWDVQKNVKLGFQCVVASCKTNFCENIWNYISEIYETAISLICHLLFQWYMYWEITFLEYISMRCCKLWN